MVQTAEGSLVQASEMAQRILALAVQGTSGALSESQKTSITTEMSSLLAGIDNIQTRTRFGSTTTTLFNGAVTIYSSNISTDSVTISSTGLAAFSTGGTALSLSTSVSAAAATATKSAAYFQSVSTAASAYITTLDKQRGDLGATQNQMEYTVNNIIELSANLTSARSRIVDTDYATETSKLTKGQILQQAATAMLAQANQMPNVILSLLK
jgi:flagellin